MAVGADVLKLPFACIVILSIKKPCFTKADSVCYVVIPGDTSLADESFIYSSIWQYSQEKPLFIRKKFFLKMILLLAGDVEICPGPVTTRFIPELQKLLNNRGMSLFHLNIQELMSSKHHIEEMLQNFENINFLSLSETHLSTDDATLTDIPGFSFVNRNRTTGKGGGVAAYISEKISWERREELEHPDLECLWLEIVLKNAKNFLICVLYRPGFFKTH